MVNPMNFVILGDLKKVPGTLFISWICPPYSVPYFKESPPSVVLLLEKPYPTRTLVESSSIGTNI